MELFPKRGKRIDGGSERTIYEHGHKPDLLVTDEGIRHPLEVKEMFYTQQLLHELFPNNFPAFPAVFVDKAGTGAAIRSRIRESTFTTLRRMFGKMDPDNRDLYRTKREKTEYEHTFSHISNMLYMLGVRVWFDFETPRNVMRVAGHWNYVDTAHINALPNVLDDAFRDAIKKDFPHANINVVIQTIERLRHIQEDMRDYVLSTLRTINIDLFDIASPHTKEDMQNIQSILSDPRASSLDSSRAEISFYREIIHYLMIFLGGKRNTASDHRLGASVNVLADHIEEKITSKKNDTASSV